MRLEKIDIPKDNFKPYNLVIYVDSSLDNVALYGLTRITSTMRPHLANYMPKEAIIKLEALLDSLYEITSESE